MKKLAAYRIPCMLTLLIALSACSTTREQMRPDARERDRFHIDLPYTTVVANFVRRGQDCYHGGLPASYFVIEKSEPAPGQSAIVEVVQYGLARRVMVSADITSAPSGSDIIYYVNPNFSIFVTFKPVMMEWAQGTGTSCGQLLD